VGEKKEKDGGVGAENEKDGKAEVEQEKIGRWIGERWWRRKRGKIVR